MHNNIFMSSILFFLLPMMFPAPSLAKDKVLKDLSTPHSSIDVYFHAYKICDFELRKIVVLDSIEMIGKESFFSRCRDFKSHEILKEGVAQSAADIFIKVSIKWKSQDKNSIMFYDLKKIDSKWIIMAWNAEEDSETNITIEGLHSIEKD